MLETNFRILVGVVLAWACYTWLRTADRINWFLDAGWVVVGVPLLIATRKAFPLTPILYVLLAIHASVLISGGYWTYELNPVGLWFKSVLGTERNHFDRFGHFLQGFVPAILFRELYWRISPIRRPGWLNYFSMVSCIAFSAVFELLEWIATLIAGQSGDAFLGHQGDIWDAQWDITWAIIGSVLAIMVLSGIHQKQLLSLVPVVRDSPSPGTPGPG
jgi:putative membrane protein